MSRTATHHFCKLLENSTYFRAKIKRYPPFFYFQLLGTVINVMLTGNYNFNHELYPIYLVRDKALTQNFKFNFKLEGKIGRTVSLHYLLSLHT